MSHPWGIRLLPLRSFHPFMDEKGDCSEGRHCDCPRSWDCIQDKRRLLGATPDTLTLLQGCFGLNHPFYQGR